MARIVSKKFTLIDVNPRTDTVIFSNGDRTYEYRRTVFGGEVVKVQVQGPDRGGHWRTLSTLNACTHRGDIIREARKALSPAARAAARPTILSRIRRFLGI